ncbi:hypothetical protein I4U23_010866 [Adineta vaga]|nr:hypothetical protein I4U23_010866 [Adineta vaga]
MVDSYNLIINHEGELFVGGVGVFPGYLRRDDLTSKGVLYINDVLFYRTGDIVKIDHNGRIYYQGRKDFQIKLHGQRIELGEIERCLLSITSISTCVVVKWGEDHLVAYVQSSVVSEKELHEYCQSHLPPHMIPSYFIILDKLPLNPNGKIDRKRLPSPDSLVLSSTKLNNTNDLVEPTNKIESIIHHIWCDLLKQKQISTNTNIFSIGGHSLIIMQLLHHYKVEFRLEINSIAITDLFQHPTIIDHAKLIHQILNTELSKDDHSWHSLNILTAKASFAQERIFLDENIRFSSSSSSSSSTDNNTNMYVIPLIYRLSSINDHHISISRLYHAYQCIIRKHQILRTALYLDQNGIIVQDCRDMNTLSNNSETFGFSIVNVSREDGDMNEIVKRILNKCDLFDLSKGHVINCHILRSHTHSSNEEDDMLNRDDLILFTVHHAFFDGASTSIFIRDLSLAYQDHSSLSLDDNSFQYVDYSVHEHVMDMTLSREFWYSQLQGCDLQHSLSLPYDRSRSSIHHRSGLGATTQIILNDVTCTSFLNYASSHHLTFFQLGLSIFYVFLFKLSHNQTDLCVGSINANRYRSELYNMIGMFVATLPYRIQLNGDWSFDEVVHSVREMCLSILKHSHYPLQHILNDFHANQSNLNFLEIMFNFITLSESESYLSMNDTKLEPVMLEQSNEAAKFDFMLTFIYDPTLENNRLSLHLICSHDLFDDGTVTDIGGRFSYCIEQLFVSNGIVDEVNMCGTAVSKLDLILAKEAKEIDDVIFDRQSNITSEAPASYAQARIWLDEQIRFDPDHPQIAIYNMPFIYHLSTNNTISVKQLQHALDLTISKHLALHTAFIFDKDKNILMQRIIDITTDQKTLFTFIESTYETQQQLNNIIHEEKRNPQLFNLTQGLVFRCHLVYYKHISSDHLLHHKDIIIFNFHHAAFDFPSMHIFLHDLNQVYTTGELLSNNNNNDDEMNIRYLDYAAIERGMSMTGAEMFWLDTLHDCKLDQSLSLPYDRYRLANEHRTGRGTSISFDFGQDLSHYFLTYASTNNISLEYLALTIYFILLFKLTNGEQDLCIGINTDGRYRDEFRSLIGMFVNAIPLRCQLDPHSSFHQFTQQMRVLMTNTMKYSYFPLQRILAQHPHLSNPAFLDTSFQFITSMTNDDQDKVNLGDNELILAPYSIEISEDEVMSKFDFILTFHHTLDPNELSCTIDASLDLFHVETVNKISQQFHSLLYDLCASIIDSQSKKPLYELSLTLPTEQLLVQSMNNTQISYPSVKCIHHEFVSKAMIYSQKLAVELDEQSLTYCELLYYVQVLSLTLLNEYRVNVGDIICQCVERSISMVIGIMAIEMVGGVYCPLSPRDPKDRLYKLVEQTQSHLILAHWLTIEKIHDGNIVVNVDSILIIALHHAAYDRSCGPIFFKDFCFAYNNASEWSEKDDEEALQYIDYTIHERQIDMKPSQEFWFSQLETYNFERPLLLPYDRSRSSNHERSGLASTIHITLNDQISTSIVNYASSQHVTLFQLGLSIFHLFLSRLTRDDDLCISCLNANRYRAELHNVIGMFVATLPYRIHLNANWSFDELVHYVKERCLSILEHSHYPLQHILSVFHLNQSNLSFLETMFDFITLSESVTYLLMNDTKLEPVMLEQSNEAAKFDFMLTFIYDPTFENGKLSFSLVGSHDLFDKKTIASIAERFSYCIEQLFSSTETMNEMDTCLISRSRLSLILPSEASEIDDVIFCRQPHIMFEVEVLRKLSKGFVDATKLPKALKYQKKQLLKSAKI